MGVWMIALGRLEVVPSPDNDSVTFSIQKWYGDVVKKADAILLENQSW